MGISVDYACQLSFLELAEYETADDGVVSPTEARQRSEAARAALGNLEKLPEWYEEFLNLVNGNWPWRVAAYIAWAASARVGRWPKTQDDLATEVLGLTSDRQIVKWKKNNRAIVDTINALQLAPMLQHRADVVRALINSAMDSDYKSHQDRKLFLEITGDYVPSAKLEAQLTRSAGNGIGAAPDELLQQYADLPVRNREKPSESPSPVEGGDAE